MTFLGLGVFLVVNLAAFLLTLAVADGVGSNKEVVVGVAAAMLALLALGGGFLLIRLRKPWTRGLGLGLMIGWALMSIVSAGFCTGLNPEIYSGGTL
ncbi:hypothetical protein GCM10009530_73820 [Microbispora corallina]|uniref:Uncharacterized protein n=1 Tax=Microbispora corallina TaxID=83302 RepID=A0ABQ4GAW8_9ACTN|nr:hypothetical protein [Microbispora corallina]GIH44217.1 hypothetical protein Mco01_72170 [Microbispora corallina]